VFVKLVNAGSPGPARTGIHPASSGQAFAGKRVIIEAPIADAVSEFVTGSCRHLIMTASRRVWAGPKGAQPSLPWPRHPRERPANKIGKEVATGGPLAT